MKQNGRQRNRLVTCLLLAAAGLAALWIGWGNTALEVTEYTLSHREIPAAFSGFRIVQISDLHRGADNETLMELLQQAQPDLIVLTGDLVDARHTDLEGSLAVAARAAALAPTYYVPGNHEARISVYDQLQDGLRQAGVTVLTNEGVSLERGDGAITLLGVQDPAFQTDGWLDDEAAVMEDVLGTLEPEGYTVLLSHRPEYVELYAQHQMDLVFSGHAHGGQIRLPVLGGVLAPGQGLFPHYDGGCYQVGDTTMIVSRGIGNSLFPVRVNNRPELVVVQLESQGG